MVLGSLELFPDPILKIGVEGGANHAGEQVVIAKHTTVEYSSLGTRNKKVHVEAVNLETPLVWMASLDLMF
jgi:hypothetical protein